MNGPRRRRKRSGNVLVFTICLMIALFSMLAFAVDVGYLCVVRSELQRSADAAALAAAWKLCEEDALIGGEDPAEAMLLNTVSQTAVQYAALNEVTRTAPAVSDGNDVQVGYLQSGGELDIASPSAYVGVRVRVRKTAGQNGAVPLFFARVLGFASCEEQADATAVFFNNIGGFETPRSGENLGILPLALDKQTWDQLMDGNGDDNFSWNEELQEVTSGSDGIPEASLFPENTGAPGNRGTVDIGSNGNSTSDIRRQILYGVTPEDLAYHGGSLVFDENGVLMLNGDTGISGGMASALETIIGQPRVIPLFTEVSGPGNNAWYTIVQFAGVRVLEVKLNGGNKRVVIQPAEVRLSGLIPASGGPQKSYYIKPVRHVWLIH